MSLQDTAQPSWSLYTGAVQTQDGRTLACFGRPARLSAQAPPLGAAAAAQLGGLDATRPLQLIWALGAPFDDGLGEHAHDGGFQL